MTAHYAGTRTDGRDGSTEMSTFYLQSLWCFVCKHNVFICHCNALRPFAYKGNLPGSLGSSVSGKSMPFSSADGPLPEAFCCSATGPRSISKIPNTTTTATDQPTCLRFVFLIMNWCLSPFVSIIACYFVQKED